MLRSSLSSSCTLAKVRRTSSRSSLTLTLTLTLTLIGGQEDFFTKQDLVKVQGVDSMMFECIDKEGRGMVMLPQWVFYLGERYASKGKEGGPNKANGWLKSMCRTFSRALGAEHIFKSVREEERRRYDGLSEIQIKECAYVFALLCQLSGDSNHCTGEDLKRCEFNDVDKVKSAVNSGGSGEGVVVLEAWMSYVKEKHQRKGEIDPATALTLTITLTLTLTLILTLR